MGSCFSSTESDCIGKAVCSLDMLPAIVEEKKRREAKSFFGVVKVVGGKRDESGTRCVVQGFFSWFSFLSLQLKSLKKIKRKRISK